MVSKICIAAIFCISSITSVAQELVRSDFDSAAGGDAVFTGWENSFSAAAVIDLGVNSSENRTFERFRFSGGVRSGGNANDGDITKQNFVLAKVLSDDFTIEEFRGQYISGGPFIHADQVMTFDTPSNEDYAIPYNTTNELHLHELDFDGLSYTWLAGQHARLLILGIDQLGSENAGEFNISFSTSIANLDFFDFSGDEIGLQSNIEFGFPYHTFAVDAYLAAANLLGDINLDGAVNLLDVQPFVDLISNGGFQIEADINQDGIVNLLDVAPFVSLISGG